MALPGDMAVVGGRLFTGLVELSTDPGVLDTEGLWVVVLPFDAPPTLARFESCRPAPPLAARPMPIPGPWQSSLSRDDFVKGVNAIREAIAAGDVYQVNLCRRLRAPEPPGFEILALGAELATVNPAPHAALVRLPSAGIFVASASPERFLARDDDLVVSEPIKGTAAAPSGLTAKDRAENVMITDLVRNDLGRICRFGTIEVPSLCRVEEHPGLVHLVSTVRGRLRPGAGWRELLAATFPPGSVTGAPKLAALDAIAILEPGRRGIYCGALGWVDATNRQGDLNVAIRTFWADEGSVHFGTGAGITWDSDAGAEWEETELKASLLVATAQGKGRGPRGHRRGTPRGHRPR